MSGLLVEAIKFHHSREYYEQSPGYDEDPLCILNPNYYAGAVASFYATKIEPNQTLKTITLLFIGTLAGVIFVSSLQTLPFLATELKLSFDELVNPTFNNLVVVLDNSRVFFGTCATILICLKVGKWSLCQLLPESIVAQMGANVQRFNVKSYIPNPIKKVALKIDETVYPLFANAFKFLCLTDLARFSEGQFAFGVFIGVSGSLMTRSTKRFTEGTLLTRLLWLENAFPWVSLGSSLGKNYNRIMKSQIPELRKDLIISYLR